MGGLSTGRALRVGGAVVAVGALLTGALHTRAGRAVLGRGGCPFDPASGAVNAEKLEEARTKSLASLRTGGRAKARPALGLELGVATKADALAWGAREHLACAEEMAGAAVRCEGRAVQSDGSALSDVFFRVSPDGRLVAVDVLREGMTAPRALETAKAVSASLAARLAAEPRVVGEATISALEAGRSSRVAFELRFDDYAADVSATNLASADVAKDHEVVVREQYRLLSPLPVR